MILFRGNCQMQFTAEAAAAAGMEVAFASLASPLTLTASPGAVPRLVETLIHGARVGEYLHTRELINQFLPPPVSPRPQALIVNLFHENSPLFLHATARYAFYLDPNAFARKPALDRAMDRHFQTIVPKPASYLDRYAAMLLLLRQRLPGVMLAIENAKIDGFNNVGGAVQHLVDLACRRNESDLLRRVARDDRIALAEIRMQM